MNVIFLGAPGAGKGTQAERISALLGIPTVSTGAMIREAIKNGTEMGRQASAYTERGALVPDEVVNGIVKERLSQADCRKGWILDGFPRTLPQAEALKKMRIRVDAVVSLEIADEKIVDRMTGRRVCPECGETYHVTSNPSPAGDRCGKCGAALTVRRDDAPEVVLSRLEVYHAQSEPLKEYYKKKVVTVDADAPLDTITDEILRALGAKKA
ncbi:MAG: adenylate kinase [Clostridia bacterium]|nr:adenylate kinase [Clostridia bacterium]MBQ4297217.1 adenylate kinase [Clostridia bacterium]